MMREKRRYLLVETSMDIPEAARKEFELELFRELLHQIGETSYFRANPKIMKFIDGNRFVLKCNLVKYKETVLALTFIKRLSGKEVCFYTLNASGTILAIEKIKSA